MNIETTTVAGYHIRILLSKTIRNYPGQAGRRKTLIDSGGYLSVPPVAWGDKVDLSMPDSEIAFHNR